MFKMYQVLAFQTFYNKIKDKKMPIKTAYKFSKLFARLDNEIKFYQEKIQAILEAYGEKDIDGRFVLTEDGAGVKIVSDKIEQCQKEIVELQNLDTQIEPVFDIEDFEGIDITVEEMQIVLPLIKE